MAGRLARLLGWAGLGLAGLGWARFCYVGRVRSVSWLPVDVLLVCFSWTIEIQPGLLQLNDDVATSSDKSVVKRYSLNHARRADTFFLGQRQDVVAHVGRFLDLLV